VLDSDGEWAATPGDLILGDFSLGSRVAARPAPPTTAILVGDTRLPPGKGSSVGGGGSFDPDLLRTVVVSRGEIVEGRMVQRSVLDLLSPGEVDATSWANIGRGRDMGSEVELVLTCEDSLTGPELARHTVFSGFSSQRGVPGREPSESGGGGEEGVRGGPALPSAVADTTRNNELAGGFEEYTGMREGEDGLLSVP